MERESIEKFEKIIKKIVMVGSILMLAAIIFIEVWAAYYTVFSADDFSIANSMMSYNGAFWDYLKSCLQYTKRMYLGWQGTYSSMFIQAIINPLNGFGLTQLRVIMVLNTLLYCVSLLAFVLLFCRIFVEDIFFLKIFFCTSILYMIINSRAYPEIFFWFCGATAYSIPVICLFISLSFFILSNIKNSKRILYAVLAALFSVGAQGGTLAISGIGCYIYLVLCLLFWLETKKISVANLVITAIVFCGALVNAVAPGNFVRHTHIEEGLHPITAITQTVEQYFQEIKLLITNDQFCVIFLLLILCGMYLCGQIENNAKVYTIISILLLITPMAAIFPVMLGYGKDAYIPNRVLFIVNTVTVLSYSNIAVAAGYWIAAFMKKKRIKFVWLICPMIALLFILFIKIFIVSDVKDTVMVKTLKDLHHDVIQTYYMDCKDIYKYLSECEEMDVVIEEFPQPIDNFGSFQLSDDPDYWVNVSVAGYYLKNSVRALD